MTPGFSCSDRSVGLALQEISPNGQLRAAISLESMNGASSSDMVYRSCREPSEEGDISGDGRPTKTRRHQKRGGQKVRARFDKSGGRFAPGSQSVTPRTHLALPGTASHSDHHREQARPTAGSPPAYPVTAPDTPTARRTERLEDSRPSPSDSASPEAELPPAHTRTLPPSYMDAITSGERHASHPNRRSGRTALRVGRTSGHRLARMNGAPRPGVLTRLGNYSHADMARTMAVVILAILICQLIWWVVQGRGRGYDSEWYIDWKLPNEETGR